MALEEVGAKLVADGEAEFISAFKKANAAMSDFDDALLKLIQTEKKQAAQADAQKMFAGMTQGQKEAYLALKQTEDQLDKVGTAAKEAGDKGAAGSKKFHLSLTDLKSGLDMAWGAIERGYNFIKQFIDAASDMNETISKSTVVFGENADAVEVMGNKAAQSMGLSKQAAIAAAATYGNLFTSMGLTSKKSAEMSMNLVQLASDFASFNNIPVADALEKIRAGLVGESEPLKSLGVNINEALLKQEALDLGLTKGNQTLSAAAKAQAAYSLMLKQSSNAQGDFARTADGVANQQRILTAEVENLTAALGQRLLPAWKEVLKIGNGALNTIDMTVNREEHLNNVLKQHSKELVASGISWEAYVKEMIRAKLVADGYTGTEGQIRNMIQGTNGDLEKLMKTWGFETEAVVSAANAEKIYADRKAESDAKVRDGTANMEAAERATRRFGGAIDEGVAPLESYKGAIKNVAMEVYGLSGGYQKMTDMILFNTLSVGLNADQQKILAIQLGILDPATAATEDAIAALNQEFQKGGMPLGEYISKSKALKDANDKLQSKEITVTTYYKNISTWSSENQWGKIGGAAAGGPIPGNAPTLVGERGPEIFVPNVNGTVIPANITDQIRAALLPMTSISAGPVTNNNSTSNSFNLNVMTSQSPQVIQRSFAMMKLLAG